MIGHYAERRRAKAFVSIQRLAALAMLPDGVNLVGLDMSYDAVAVMFEHHDLPLLPSGAEPPVVMTPGYDLVEIIDDNGTAWYRREYSGMPGGPTAAERNDHGRLPSLDLRADHEALSVARSADITRELMRYGR